MEIIGVQPFQQDDYHWPVFFNHTLGPIYNYTWLTNDILSNALAPLPCHEGLYCPKGKQENVQQPMEAWCHPTEYCPRFSDAPALTDPGHFSDENQSAIQYPCSPRSFAPDNGTIACSITPAGYMNDISAESEPDPCNKAQFRENDIEVFCQTCDFGTYQVYRNK